MSIDLEAQTRGIAFNEIRKKNGNGENFNKAYEKAMEDVKLTGGDSSYNEFGRELKGAENGMTHRMVWN